MIDDEDYAQFSKWKWKASHNDSSHYRYATRSVTPTKSNPNHRTIVMHREIMKALPGQFVDHVNGNSLDNRKENLRLCTHADNMRNRRISKGTRSGMKGVHANANGKRWIAHIQFNKKQRHLGVFDTKEEAATCYNNEAKRLFGEFHKPNSL